MKVCWSSCDYADMVAKKYGKTLIPKTCDLFKDNMCPYLFEAIIDNTRVIAYREIHGDELKQGDMYIAKRNTGWKLGKCLYVNNHDGYVVSDPPCELYSYDCHECYKVLKVLDES